MKRLLLFFTVIAIVISAIFSYSISNAQSVPSYVPSSGLVAWYPFTGGPTDSSGNGHHGSIIGLAGYTYNRLCQANRCYVGNNSTGINIDYLPGFPVGNSARSVSVWFKLPIPYPGGEREMIAWGNNTTLGQRWGLHANDTVIGLEYRNGLVYISKPNDSAWHNIVITYPGSGGSSSVQIYLDSSLQTSAVSNAVSSFNTDTGTIHTIAALSLAPSNLYNWVGELDDIGVWNRALSASEVSSLYNGATYTAPTVSISVSPNNIINTGTNYTFTATVTNGGSNITYQWKINGNNVGASSQNLTTFYVYAGDIITCTISSNTGCFAPVTSNGIHMIVSRPLLSGTTHCPGSVLTLTSNFNPLQIIWKQNGTTVHTTNAGWNANATTVAGGSGQGNANSQLMPIGVCTDSNGNIYAVDNANARVMKWAPGVSNGVVVAGGNGTGNAANQLSSPFSICIDAAGNLYIGDLGNTRVQKWAPGASSGVTLASGISTYGLCLDAAGNLYVTDPGSNSIKKFTPGSSTGTIVAGGNGPGTGTDQLNLPINVFADATGNLYINDFINGRVQKWAPGASSGTTVAGGSSGATGSAIGMYVDANGTVYLASQSGYIDKWINGTLVTIAGTGTGAAANQLNDPMEFCFDPNGNLYVADKLNYRVQKFSIIDTMTYTATSAGNYTAVVTTIDGIDSTVADTIGAVLTSPLTNQVCNGVAFSYSPSSNTSGTTFSWSRAVVSGISNAAATGTGSIGETLVNTTSAPINVTYTYTVSSTLCSGTQNITVTVSPPPTLTSTLSPAVQCDNTAINYSQASSISGTSFSWSRPATAGISNPASSGTGNINELLTDTTTSPVTVIYTDTLTAYGCTNIQNVSVTVKPTPVLTSNLFPSSICNNTSFTYSPTSSLPNTTFSWSRPATYGINNPASFSTGNIGETLHDTTSQQVTIIYTYVLASNGCTDTESVSMKVKPIPILSSPVYPTAICNNATFSYIPLSVTLGTTYTWTRAAVTGLNLSAGSGSGSISETFINSTTDLILTYYYYTLNIGGCTNVQSIPVYVVPTPTLTSGYGPPGICSGNLFNYYPASSTSGVTFTWTRAAISGISNAASSGTGNPNEHLYNTSTSPIGVAYTYYASVQGCTDTLPYNVIDTVYNLPAINTQALNETVCEGNTTSFSINASAAGIYYQWQMSTGSGFNNVSPSVTYSGINTNTLSVNNASSSMNGYQYKCIVSGTCSPPSTSNVYTLSVRGAPFITSSSQSDSTCEGGNAQLYVSAGGTGLSYQWYSYTSSGLVSLNDSGSYSGTNTNTLSITGTTSAMNGNTYKCIVSGLCSPPAISANAVLTVFAYPTVSSSPSNVTICAGSNALLVTRATGGALTYQWQANTGLGYYNIANNAPYSGVTSDSLTITNTSLSMNGYKYLCVVNGFCSSPAFSSYAVLNVNRVPTITAQPRNDTVCAGNNASFSLSVLGNSLVYQWQADTGTGFSNVVNSSLYSGANYNSLSIANASAQMNGYHYRCVINGSCTPPAVTSSVVSLKVNTAPSITSQSSLSTICEYADAFFSVIANGSGLSYRWYQNGMPISDTANVAGSHTYNLGLAYEPPYGNGNVYYCVITGTCSPQDTSTPITLTVNTFTNITTQASGSTICAGNNTSFSIHANGSNISYQWKANGININNGGMYSGANTNILNITNASASLNGYAFQCVVSGSCGVLSSDTAILTVHSLPAIHTQEQNDTVCEGSSTSFPMTASGTGLIFQWQVDTGTGFSNISPSSVYSNTSSGALAINNVSAAMNSYHYRCIVTGTCNPPDTSTTATLTVFLLPSITTLPSNDTICAGDNALYSVSAHGTGLSYQWQLNIGTGFVNLSSNAMYPGVSTDSLQINNVSNAMNGYIYRCLVSGQCTPPVYSNTPLLIVHSLPAINIQAEDARICRGGDTSFSITATGTNITYQWQTDTGTGFHNLSNNAIYYGVTNNVIHIVSALSSMNAYHYRCIVNGVCNPPAISSNASLSVLVAPSITTQAANSAICENDNTSFSIATSGSSLNYQWQKDTSTGFVDLSNSGIYSGATTNTLDIALAPVAINGSTYRCLVTGICSPPIYSSAYSLTVNTPLSLISQSENDTICAGDNTALKVVATGTLQSYQWQEDTGSGFHNMFNNGQYAGVFTDSLAISSPNTAINGHSYRCIISGPCTVLTSIAAKLIVHPLPNAYLSAAGPLSFCAGDSVLLNANTGTGLAYQWQKDNNNITGATNIGYHASMPGGYRVIVSNSYDCHLASVPDTIHNYPIPVTVINASGPLSFCSYNTTILSIIFDSNLNYQWKKNDVNIAGANDTSYTPTISGNYSVSASNQYGCIATAPALDISIHFIQTPPLYELSGVLRFCDGDSVKLGTDPNYISYQWHKNGINIPGAIGQTCVFHNTGAYSVAVSNAYCTAVSAPDSVESYPLPYDSIIAIGHHVICPGGGYPISTINVTGQAYRWYDYGIFIPGADSSQYIATNAGSYNVQISSINGCSIFTSSVNVTNVSAPTPHITAHGLTLQTEPYVAYQWYRDSLAIPIAVNQTYQIIQNGSYAVSVTDSNGCSGMSASYSINSLGASNNELHETDVNIYPNPASTIIYFEATIPLNVSITDVFGKIILQKNNAKSMDINRLANAVYTVRVYNENNILLKTEKLIKNNP